MDKLAKQLGKRISDLRIERGLMAEQFAYEHGMSKGYLSDLENGKRLPSLKMLQKLAKALEVEMKDFF